MKRLGEILPGLLTQAWREKKKARGFDTPGEFGVSPNTKNPEPQSIYKMRAPVELCEVMVLHQNAHEPMGADVALVRSMGAAPVTGCPGEGHTGAAARHHAGEHVARARKLKG